MTSRSKPTGTDRGVFSLRPFLYLMPRSDPDATTPEPSTPKEYPKENKGEDGKDQPGLVKCADCGEFIKSHFNSKGEAVKTAGELIEGSKKAFGRPLCYNCCQVESKVLSARQKAAAAKV